jgi:Tfp pilus assembly protein PilF
MDMVIQLRHGKKSREKSMLALINRASFKKLILILFVVGFATYLSSFTNQFVWDDDHFFHQNLFTQSLTHIQEIFTSNTTAGAGVSSNYYRPIATYSFAIDHALWGWNPIGLHFTNTLFHVFNGILLFLFLLLLRFGKVSSFLVSVIFLIHPIQTEAVTYLSSRGDIFYTFFLLLSLHLFTIALYKKNVHIVLQNKTIVLTQNLLLVLSVLLFPLSVLSKEGALTTVPIYAAVLLVFSLQKKLSFKKLHQQHKNHFIAIMLIIWITLVYFGLRLTVLNFNDSLNYSGDQTEYAKHLSIRIYTFIKTIVIYIQLLLVPYPLYLERSTEIVTTPLNMWVITSIGIMFFAFMAGCWEVVKKHTGWIFFALVLIFANLLSVSGIIPMTALIRENWLYMPMIGFYMIIITIGRLAFLPFITSHRNILSTVFVFMCLILAGMTIQQNYNWRDRIAYFEHNLRFTNTARLHLNLGNAYLGKKDHEKAMYHLQQAAKIEDYYPQTHYNLAHVYIEQGKLDQAEKELVASLALDPNYLYSYPVLIGIYEKQNKPEKAVPYLKRLIKIYPNDLKITIMYANNLYLSGNIKEADIQFAKALELSNNDPKLIQAIAETKKTASIPH